VVGLTKSLAMEVDSYGIRVNAICPSPVLGDRMERVLAQETAAR
jgi:NAD(P)-dependent dehydrogenase (short-subunit alcohol dehydrogenase family)